MPWWEKSSSFVLLENQPEGFEECLYSKIVKVRAIAYESAALKHADYESFSTHVSFRHFEWES